MIALYAKLCHHFFGRNELTRTFRVLDKGAVICMRSGPSAVDLGNYIVPVWTI